MNMHSRSKRIVTAAVIATGVLAACGRQVEAEAADPEFDPVQVVKRKFPAITDPPLLEAAEAGSIRDEELVLGVAIGGEARAYPINMLTGPRREIINDKLGGRAIAATW